MIRWLDRSDTVPDAEEKKRKEKKPFIYSVH
jgi:hypothetical protein